MPPPKPQRDRMKRERLAMGREDKTVKGWFNHPVRGPPVPLSGPVLRISCHAGRSGFAGAELERFGPDDQWMRPGAWSERSVIPPMLALPSARPESSVGSMQMVQAEPLIDSMQKHPSESSADFMPCYRPRDFSDSARLHETSLRAEVQTPSYRRDCYRGPPSTRSAPYQRLRHVADRWGAGPE